MNQSTFALSMQRESVQISDDEEECCIIAEIPRRKKALGYVDVEKKPEVVSPSTENIQGHASFPPFAFKKSSLNVDANTKEQKAQDQTPESEEVTRIQPKKFFNSQRVCRNTGKIGKCRLSYRNHLRRRMTSMQESYRLTEKYQYMQLLQSHTTFNLLTVRPSPKNNKGQHKLPSVIEVIDLTSDKENDGSYNVPESKPVAVPESQDVQIIKEVSKVRSFQDLLKIRPVTTEITTNELASSFPKGSTELVKLNYVPEDGITIISDSSSKKTETLEDKLRNFLLDSVPSVEEVETIGTLFSLPELSSEQLVQVKNALIPEPKDEVLSQAFGLRITRRDMQTLQGLNWLNDEVINFYCNLIMERSKVNKKLPRVYAFNTFFYPKLVTNGYSSIRRWTKQVDIFSFDIILVPVHLGMHWCMTVIDFRNKSVRYYDSIGSPNDSCLERLLMYLKAESLDKKKEVFSTNNWEKLNVDEIPQQMNGADCGVFSCMFAEYLTRDCVISFTQDNTPYFRKKMVFEILKKKLLT